ncbi:Caprin-1 [Schistosoma japonicum]|nr:Caprin-1 [Schistosoma japonicum]
MQELGDPCDLVRQFLSNLERRQRNLGKRKSKLDGYREKLQKGEVLKDEQKKAVGSYDGVVQNISFVQEIVTQTKDLLSNMESVVEKQMSQIEVEHEKYTLSYLSTHLCLQRFLASLDIPTVRTAVAKSSSENSLKLLDAVRDILTSPVVDNWPVLSSSALSSVPSFLQGREDLKAVATNTFNLVSGRSVSIPLPNDLEDFRKKHTTYKDVRNLCFRLLSNPLVQQTMGLTSNCVTTSAAGQAQLVVDVETSSSLGLSGPGEITTPQNEYVTVGRPSIAMTDEPVDQVIRPLNSTFNFIQASRVDHSHITVEHPTNCEDVVHANPLTNKATVPCFTNHNLEENNIDQSPITRMDQQYVMDIPEVEHPKTGLFERSSSPLSSGNINQTISLKSLMPHGEDEMNNSVHKPISYADSVRRAGQHANFNRPAVVDNVNSKRTDRVPDENLRESEQMDPTFARVNPKVGFRSRIPNENRGRGNGPKRNIGQRGSGNFGVHPGRGAHRGIATAFAQPTY